MTEYDTITYGRSHKRVKRIRGPASDHMCERCDQWKAEHWATVHGTPGQNPWTDFWPLCYTCHMVYDGVWDRNSGPLGEANGSAKLTENNVRQIRCMIAAGHHTQKEIARIFGVAPSQITYIKQGRHWGWLD